MIAVGNLEKVLFVDTEVITEKELYDSFRNRFEGKWDELLDVTDYSFAYNSANDTYFSVRALQPLENLTLLKFLKQYRNGRPLNIIVS